MLYAIRALSTEHYSPQQIEAIVESQELGRRRRFAMNKELLYGAWLESRLVSISAMSTFWGTGSVDGIFVHPDFVRRGIGRQMLMKLEETALERKCVSMNVWSSLTAVNLYESVGYARVCSHVQDHKNERIACMVMNKTIDYAGFKRSQRRIRLGLTCFVAASIAIVASFM